jgi:hypothetical protein
VLQQRRATPPRCNSGKHADVEQVRFVEHLHHHRVADHHPSSRASQAPCPAASESAKLPRVQGKA